MRLLRGGAGKKPILTDLSSVSSQEASAVMANGCGAHGRCTPHGKDGKGLHSGHNPSGGLRAHHSQNRQQIHFVTYLLPTTLVG